MFRPAGDNPLTTQHDFKTDYRARRPTLRRRRYIRRQRRFTRRVSDALIRNTTYPKHVLRTQRFTRVASENQQAQFAVLLHTVDGIPNAAGGNEQADWREFFREGGADERTGWDNANNPAFFTPGTGTPNRAMRCLRATIEVTIRNTGTTSAILNVYRIYCTRNVRSNFISLEQVYEAGFNYAGEIEANPETETGLWDRRLLASDIGSTPFQSRVFCQHFKIVRRTKYQLAPGEEINLTFTDRRSRLLMQRYLQGNSFVRKLTTGWFVEFNGVPAQVPPAGPTINTTATLSTVIHKRYSVVLLPQKKEQSSFDTPDV